MKKMKEPIHYKEPFWTAGLKFGWSGHAAGIGLRKDLLEDYNEIKITVGEDKEAVYSINTSAAKMLVNKYDSYYEVNGKELAVVPWQEFTYNRAGVHKLPLNYSS